MEKYVLRHNETGKYVATPGSNWAYTAKLENARTFATREEAERDRCVECESIIPLSELLR